MMQVIIEVQTQQKINSFLGRKARQFPELHLKEDWQRRGNMPHRYFAGGTKKYQLLKEI